MPAVASTVASATVDFVFASTGVGITRSPGGASVAVAVVDDVGLG